LASKRAQTTQTRISNKPWHEPGIEPSLKEMLDDPLIQFVMKRDGVTRADIETLIGSMRARFISAKPYSTKKAA